MEEGEEALGSSARITGLVAAKAGPEGLPSPGLRPSWLSVIRPPKIGIQPARYTASQRSGPAGAVEALSTIIVHLTTKLSPYGAR
jgi:hypothetical protein